MGRPLFLLGAGFNADAKSEAGPIRERQGVYSFEVNCGYPLVKDMALSCLGLKCLPSGKSVEDLLWAAIEVGNYEPMKKLSEELRSADYRLPVLLSSSRVSNCYQRFFDRFNMSNFLTFNYDSFPEIFLFKRGEWFPHDGYGVPVRTLHRGTAHSGAGPSSVSLVAHLHGSFCLNRVRLRELADSTPTDIKLAPRDEPEIIFDPYSLANIFAPYKSPGPQHGDIEMEHRVIAPVPEKTTELAGCYFRRVYERARELTRECKTIIAIGYSFSPHDAPSYDPIIEALSTAHSARLFIVAPDASTVIRTLSKRYPGIEIICIEETLKSWSALSFRGIPDE